MESSETRIEIPVSKDAMFDANDEDLNDSPIEQVRLTVSTSDDPTLHCLTFRTWFIGLISCVLLSFINQFFNYRRNQMSISTVSVQILALPLGKLMAATLPTKVIHVPGTGWSFSLNPGPFNLKEHVLITIFASAGAGSVYAIHILTSLKAFYHRPVNLGAALLLSFSTQLLGFGWAGIFRKFLVDSPYMWWPSNLVQVSLFRALHEIEKRRKGGLTRLQFFLVVLVSSFAYFVIPGYIFPTISALSVACWIWKGSVTAQQIGSGNTGLGIGAFSFDWNTITMLGSPLATPGFAIVNTLVGFVITMYIVLPFGYWNNYYGARKFPIITQHLFDHSGNPYNISRILNQKEFTFNQHAYDSYSDVNMSIFFALLYGINFATLTATLSHVALFYSSTIWNQTKAAINDKFGDVHTRLMKKNYGAVPQIWFCFILGVVFLLAVWACEGFGKVLQLPYWGIMLAMALSFVFTLPIGIIQATTNQQAGLNVISEMILGYMLPGKPLANVVFKTYSYISMTQALSFLQDFKLGHYMKIPPKSMFVVQIVGTMVSSVVYFATAWWLLNSIPNICDTTKLPADSPWTCPGDDTFYNASIIWGVVGPMRMFGKLGHYSGLNYFFLFGALAPVPFWLLAKKFPEKKWIGLINTPIIISGAGSMLPGKSINYTCWFTVGLFFSFYVYRRHRSWWARHNYILSAGLDAGLAFMGILLFLALGYFEISWPQWWGIDSDDKCALTKCPTVPGIHVKGCPAY